MDSSLHRLSLHINVMRTKGLKQLVHEIAIYATLVLFFNALRSSHAFEDVRVV